MRHAFRVTLVVAKWIAVVAGTLLAIVLLVNSRDQELSSAARSLADFHAPAIPDNQNAYLALIGFDAPSGGDPIAMGARIVGDNNGAAASDPRGWRRLQAGKYPTVEGADRLKFIGSESALHDPLDAPCLSQAVERSRDIRLMIEANEVLAARYLAMQKLPVYADTSFPDILVSFPPSVGWISSRRLLLMRSCLDAQTGQEGRALEFLAADGDMWRRVLGNGTLLDEMIAVRGLASDFRVLSDLIATPAFDVRANEAKLRQILSPLSAAQLNMALPFKREFELHANMASALQNDIANSEEIGWTDRLMYKWFYKTNASLNQLAQLFIMLQTPASSPPSEFVLRWNELQNEAQAQSTPGIRWAYNPLGRMTAGMSIPAYEEYVTRVFDLAAYVNLVRAQFELRLASVPANKASDFLTTLGPEARNPYTNHPFEWNTTDRSLSFEPRSRRWHEWSATARVPSP